MIPPPEPNSPRILPQMSPGGSNIGTALRQRAWSYSGPEMLQLKRAVSAPGHSQVPAPPPLSHLRAMESPRNSLGSPTGKAAVAAFKAKKFSLNSPRAVDEERVPFGDMDEDLPTDEIRRMPQRARSLSETGRKLFFEVYEGDLLDASPSFLSWPSHPPVKENGNINAPPNVTHADLSTSNAWAAFYSDDEEEEELHKEELRRESSFQALVRRNTKSHVNPQELTMRSGNTPPTQDRIEESVIGEDETEIAQWETVKKKKKEKKERAPVAAAESLQQDKEENGSESYSYYSDDEYDDLYDLQFRTFGSRQVGGAKKTMQFKAAEKRGWAIDKRNRQRMGG